MLLLAFLDYMYMYLGAVFVLATIGIVDCTFTRPIPMVVYGERLFYVHLDGAEQNENVTLFDSYCTLLRWCTV